MKRFLMLCAAFCIAACTTATTTQQAQAQYVQACTAYGAAFGTALTLRQAGKLSPAAIAQISSLDQTITPICTGPLPADPALATNQITAAATTLAVIEAVKATTGAVIASPTPTPGALSATPAAPSPTPAPSPAAPPPAK